MEQEIKKHTDKIYHEVIDKGKSWKARIGEIFIEIFTIVFAVTLSIWLHSWNEERHQQDEVKEFLQNLRTDLIEELKTQPNDSFETLKLYKFINNITPQDIDSLNQKYKDFYLLPPTKVMTWGDINANYESFKSSGKIGYIKNKEIKSEILWYFQMHAPSLKQIDNEIIRRNDKLIDYLYQHAGNKNDIYLRDPYVRSQVSTLYKLCEVENISTINTRKHMKTLIRLIDEELK